MGKRKNISDETIAKVYKQKLCNMSSTAIALNVERKTLYEWINKSPKLQAMINDANESMVDFTETKLIEKINEGDLTAIIFHLKTKGKNRGFVDRSEVTGKDGKDLNTGPITVEVIDKREQIDNDENTDY